MFSPLIPSVCLSSLAPAKANNPARIIHLILSSFCSNLGDKLALSLDYRGTAERRLPSWDERGAAGPNLNKWTATSEMQMFMMMQLPPFVSIWTPSSMLEIMRRREKCSQNWPRIARIRKGWCGFGVAFCGLSTACCCWYAFKIQNVGLLWLF